MYTTHSKLTATMPSFQAIPNKTSSTGLCDQDLIQAFVEGFAESRPLLLSNHNLRTEPLFESMQLMAKGEGVIATANLTQAPMKALVRSSSSYWASLHQGMTEQGFFPTTQNGKGKDYTYRYCQAPEGYELHCTTARGFWRACWARGLSINTGIALDVMVWYQPRSGCREGWQAIRGIDYDSGQLVLKLLGGSMEVRSSDLLVWTRKRSKYRATRPGESQHNRPNVRGHLRLNN